MKFLKLILQKLGYSKNNENETNNKVNIEQEHSTRKTTKEIQQDFLKNLNLNTNDVLNPSVCKGENFIKNILLSLGANKELLNNQIVLTQIKPIFIKMVPPYVLEKIENKEEFTENEIKECLYSFFEKTNLYSEMLNGTKSGKSLCIDKNGNVSTIDCVIGDKDKMIIENDYYTEGENLITLKREGDTQFSRIATKSIYNNLGVLIGKEKRTYTKPTEYTVVELIRDSRFPFIIYKRVGEKNSVNLISTSKVVAYPILDPNDCINMNISSTIQPLESIEEKESFYKNNKKQVLEMFNNLANLNWVNPITGIRKSDIIKLVETSSIAQDFAEVKEF